MKLPRDLSGAELVQLLYRHSGYRPLEQEGSHVILQTEIPQHHRLSIPDHRVLRVGAVNAILRAVARAQGIEKEDILARL